jgi:hypothetical protein
MERLEGYIYLAGPYSSSDIKLQQTRFEKLNEAAASLMKKGWIVYSPISHNHPIATRHDLPTGWSFWGRMDKVFIQHALFVVVLTLPGWKESIGVQAEIELAQDANKLIVYLDPSTNDWYYRELA